MFHRIMRPAAILCAAALLAACEQQPPPAEEQAMAAAIMERTASPFDAVPYMRLVIKGANAARALDSSAKVEGLLDDMGAPDRPNLLARINALLQSPTGQLAGLGGIQSRAALETAKVTLNDANGNYGGPLRTFDVKGQIQDEVDLGGGTTEAGFYYKPGDPMHIWVEMITTTSRLLPNGMVKSKSMAEMFRVEVPAASVNVEDKDTADSGSVFPDFAAEAFAVNADMAAPFLYKLWAVGNAVQVTDYWLGNVPANGAPNYPAGQKYTQADHPAKYANIFNSDSEACIDMMFQLDPRVDVAQGGALDNGRLPADADPPYYCLGRCQSPTIVNTR